MNVLIFIGYNLILLFFLFVYLVNFLILFKYIFISAFIYYFIKYWIILNFLKQFFIFSMHFNYFNQKSIYFCVKNYTFYQLKYITNYYKFSIFIYNYFNLVYPVQIKAINFKFLEFEDFMSLQLLNNRYKYLDCEQTLKGGGFVKSKKLSKKQKRFKLNQLFILDLFTLIFYINNDKINVNRNKFNIYFNNIYSFYWQNYSNVLKIEGVNIFSKIELENEIINNNINYNMFYTIFYLGGLKRNSYIKLIFFFNLLLKSKNIKFLDQNKNKFHIK